MARDISELDLLDLQKQGQELYRKEKFEEALKCFDQAILSDAKAPASILDNRAATYTKLGRLKPALRDGKRMIEREKSNCSGYLRTGQILQLMGNFSTALDIYQLGLRNVPSSDVQAKILQNLRDNLGKRFSPPPKAIDPMEFLPIEIVKFIIGYLSFRETVPLLRVSKSWKSVLISLPELWTNLDLNSARKRVKLHAVRQYVKHAQRRCFALRFNSFSEDEEPSLDHVVSRCKGLRELRISSGFVDTSFAKTITCAENLKTLILSSGVETYPYNTMDMINQCVNLERAEIHRMKAFGAISFKLRSLPNLRILLLNSPPDSPTFLRIDELVENIPNVQSLTLRGWHMLDTPSDFSCLLNLEHLNITASKAFSPARVPTSLRSLNMAVCRIEFHEDEEQKIQTMPNLSTLIVEGYVESTIYRVPCLRQLLEANKGGIHTLDLSGLIDMTNEEIAVLIKGGFFSGVEVLRLKEISLDDSLASLIAQNLPLLKSLDLSRTQVTGVGVKCLLTSLRERLEWLGLDECSKTSFDAVEYARSKGVKVSYKFPDGKGGKKVRGL